MVGGWLVGLVLMQEFFLNFLGTMFSISKTK